MSLTNAQYDTLMRDYQIQQTENRHIVEERRAELYRAIPELERLDDEIATRSIQAAKARLMGEKGDSADLHQQIQDIVLRKDQLITEAGFPRNYLEPPYRCIDCKDTGYVNGSRCHCLKQASINLVYRQANLSYILTKENFDTFDLEYYSDAVKDDQGVSSRENAKKAKEFCESFCQHFSEKGGNIFLYGNTGTGKTFLSNCIAKTLLDEGISVIYKTAVQLNDIFDKYQFHRSEMNPEDYEKIFSTDLLIIDDLGTEAETKFTQAQFFMCINERILQKKSTIVSTNLTLGQFEDRYSERAFSRVSANYNFIKMFGQDIRIKKKFI